MTDQTIVINTPEGIKAYRLLALKVALSLESEGLRMSRGFSALRVVKAVTGLTARTAAKMLPLYEAWLRERGYLK